MIHAADVGIGVVGKEGREAANSSDFGVARFAFLQELLLVHGRYNVYRNAKVRSVQFSSVQFSAHWVYSVLFVRFGWVRLVRVRISTVANQVQLRTAIGFTCCLTVLRCINQVVPFIFYKNLANVLTQFVFQFWARMSGSFVRSFVRSVRPSSSVRSFVRSFVGSVCIRSRVVVCVAG